MQSDSLTFITQIPPTSLVRIMGIQTDRLHRSHLAQLGLTDGTPVRVIRNRQHEPMLIGFRNSKIIIGRSIASKIQVSEIS